MTKKSIYFAPVFAILVFVSSAVAAFACSEDGKTGIAPENTMYIPDNGLGDFPLTEEQFNSSIARAVKLYTPVFEAQGRKFEVESRWTDGKVNAYANRQGKTSKVHMFGGLARHPNMTQDGFELVICHEIGHHLAGAPKIRGMMGTWASNEGESDYFATLKCAREMWDAEDNEAVIKDAVIPALVTERCQKGFDKGSDIAICKRAAIAGKALGDTLATLGDAPATQFETPSTAVVKKTNNKHPAAQCRLDTYFAGAVCSKSKNESRSDTDPTVGACSQEKGDVLGIRPLCWYAPVDPNAPKTSTWPSSKLSLR
jgi:hypothetical protein